MICAWRALMSQRRGMTQPVVLFVSVTAPFSMPCDHAGKLQRVSQGDLFVICGILEFQRQDARVHQVRLMDARKADGDDRADAQIQRHQRRVLTAGALAVVGAAHDKAALCRHGARGEFGVAHLKAVVCQIAGCCCGRAGSCCRRA